MDQSRRAVESYWRSRMVDGVTADDDKVAPVYKLEEICELLRASDASIVKEVADFILKRLDNKSPLVKQKVGALASASAMRHPGSDSPLPLPRGLGPGVLLPCLVLPVEGAGGGVDPPTAIPRITGGGGLVLCSP